MREGNSSRSLRPSMVRLGLTPDSIVCRTRLRPATVSLDGDRERRASCLPGVGRGGVVLAYEAMTRACARVSVGTRSRYTSWWLSFPPEIIASRLARSRFSNRLTQSGVVPPGLEPVYLEHSARHARRFLGKGNLGTNAAGQGLSGHVRLCSGLTSVVLPAKQQNMQIYNCHRLSNTLRIQQYQIRQRSRG